MRIFLVSFAAICAMTLATPAISQLSLPPDFFEDTIVTGLDRPNSMAFLPDGRLLFTELNSGKIRMVVNGHIAAIDPVATVDSLTTGGERGLQGIAVDPRWPAYPYVYACYTHVGPRSVLVRYTAIGDVNNASGNLLLREKRTLIHDLPDEIEFHNGLGLRFGGDGMLLMTTGDDGSMCAAQIPGALQGKLLRMDVSRVPAGGGGPVPRALLIPSTGNPFAGPDSNASLVLALGFRNPWRFHVDPMTGAILLADVGESLWEEIDEIVPGGNYGWPFREGPAPFTPTGCTDPGGVYDAPIVSVQHSGLAAILTAGIYRPVPGGTSNWPSIYHGTLFYGDYFASRLRRLIRSGSSWIPAPPVPGQPNADDWLTGMRFVPDFAIGPLDGSLYWLRDMENFGVPNSGWIKRIRYDPTPTGVEGSVSRTLSVAPNPFQDHVELAWTTRAPEPATIEIFDMAGRRLTHASVPASLHGRFEWNGRDDRGAPLPAALYLVRIQHGTVAETARVLKLR